MMRNSLLGFTALIWRKHHPLLLWLLLGFLAPWFVFLKVAQELWEDKGFPIDQLILDVVHAHHSAGQDAVAQTLAQVGGPLWMPGLEAIVLVGLLWAGFRRAALFILLSTGGAALLNLFVKFMLARARPDVVWAGVTLDSYSFPSGHAMAAAALGLTVAILLWPTRARWLAVVLGTAWMLLMGWSRVYLGVHFPSDVLAGWVGSIGWVVGVHMLFTRSADEAQNLWGDARIYWAGKQP
ncbi:phosphatase PAP2 family protein [Hymenobacter sp. DG25B]|uniref:phosphatase PAP2 family protein n=1 Tax=Hymenobacter sp. DG25B TaxID=1385664 RepID=UPI0006628A5B|nr:phosphatase PAP2 family protein [Hymenobacter sp. DG25B]